MNDWIEQALHIRAQAAAATGNDRAAELLAGRSEIVLTLRVTNSPGRARLKIDRVYFQEPDRLDASDKLR
jgi:hypothetical protein